MNSEKVHSFISEAFKQELEHIPLLTFWLNTKKTAATPDGVLKFGGLDVDHCTSAYQIATTNNDCKVAAAVAKLCSFSLYF